MSRPRLLDLFCGAGGCSVGYHRAGFDVVGVDHRPQPNYPFEFHQADALTYPPTGFDAIHASPPCQGYLNLTRANEAMGREHTHTDLISATRALLVEAGLPYVIENVPDALRHLHDPIRLCGSSFGLAVRRHRLFECSFPVMSSPCAHHLHNKEKFWTGWRPNGEARLAKVVQVYGNAGGKHEWPAAMGIDWMTDDELSEAIPPAYCEHVGSYLLAAIHHKREEAA